jgi:hypothetical protein
VRERTRHRRQRGRVELRVAEYSGQAAHGAKLANPRPSRKLTFSNRRTGFQRDGGGVIFAESEVRR